MKHNLFSRFISVLLAVVMLAGLMSMPSLADTVTGTDAAATDNVNITEDDTEATTAPAALSEEGGEGDKEPADSNESSEPTDDTETTGDVQEPEEGTEDTQEPADTTEGTDDTQEPADTTEGTGDGEADTQDQDETSQTVDGQALLDELMAKSDEDLLPAVQSLSDEQVAALEALGEDALSGLLNRLDSITAAQEESDEPLAVEDFNSMSAEDLYNYLCSLTDDAEYMQVMDSLSEEKKAELWDYIDVVTAGETVTDTSGEETVTSISAAPLIMQQASAMPRMARMMALNNVGDSGDTAGDTTGKFNQTDKASDGVVIDKSVVNYDVTKGQGTLKLEAYVTGRVETSTESVPLDIVLVLDESGSMANSFDGQTKYIVRNVTNSTAKRYNSQLFAYYDGEYHPVTITYDESKSHYRQIPTGTQLNDLKDNGQYYAPDGNGEYILLQYKTQYHSGFLGWGSWTERWLEEPDGDRYLFNSQNEQNVAIPADKPVYEFLTGAYTYSVQIEGASIDLGTSYGANGTPPVTLYSMAGGSEGNNKIDALRTAASNFISMVAQDAEENNVEHRVAIVGYSGSSRIYVGSSNDGQPAYAFQDVTTADGRSNLNASINSLSTNGSTYIHYGINDANDIFEANPITGNSDRKNVQRVLIMFTDGEPGGSSYEEGEANRTISSASKSKELGATVYTVGIFDSADARIGRDWQGNPKPMSFGDKRPAVVNRFMHLVSSNYLEATDTEASIDTINKDLPVKDNPTQNDYYSGYYLSAANADELSQAFQNISTSISTPSQNLDATTVLYDELSQYVELPEGTEEKDIVVYSMSPNTDDEGWHSNNDKGNYTVTFDDDKKGIKVSGFDYSKNFVTEGKSGKKLVVEIPFVVDSEAVKTFGGDMVDTNTNTSGIYDQSGENCFANFDVPQVEAPVNYRIAVQDQTIYLTNSADLTKLMVYASGYEPNGTNNAKVEITYTLKNGNTTIATLTIPAGTPINGSSIGWNPTGSLNPTDLDHCTDYTITCDVKSVGNSQYSEENQNTYNETATVHVLKPTIVWQDTTLNYNTQLTNTVLAGAPSGTVNLVSVQWQDLETGHVSGTPAGGAPELSYTFKNHVDEASIVDQYLTDDLNVEVEVTANEKDITEHTDFKWQENPSSGGCTKTTPVCADPNGDGYQFRIHVGSAQLTFTKNLDKAVGSGKTATFTIKIEEMNEGNVVATYYKTLTFTGTDMSKSFTMTLPTGTYKITELKTGGYANGDIENDSGATSSSGQPNTWVLNSIGLNLKVTNTSSNPTYPNDHESAVNEFTYNKDASEWSWDSVLRADKTA